MVMVVIALPLIVLLASFVIDIANWWVHKRHLQIQADASALAGGRAFTFPNCDDATIRATADRYSGVGSGGVTYNPPSLVRVTGDRLHMAFNSPGFYARTSTVDADLSGSPSPCGSGIVDVKMTETDTPWFFNMTALFGIGGPQFIDAHARVQLERMESGAGRLPIGVEDVNPKRVHAWFYDIASGAAIGDAELKPRGSAGKLAVYDTSESIVNLPTNLAASRRIGVKVALSGSDSVTCGQPLVLCYGGDEAAGKKSLAAVRTYTSTAPPTGARLGSVDLGPSAGSCDATALADNWESGYFSTTCTQVSISADIFGLGAAPDATVQASYTGSNKKATLALVGGRWTGTMPAISLASGAQDVTIAWSRKTGTVNGLTCTAKAPCTGTFTDVHRTFSGDRPISGPIKRLTVAVNGTPNAGNIDVTQCTNPSAPCQLLLELGLQGSLKLAGPSDPPVALRVFSGSVNQSLDCDPSVSQLDDEIAYGCAPAYARNTGQACPASPNTLWASAQPWTCAAIQTGTNANAPARGLNTRILGSASPASCTSPNRYPSYPPDDPRTVPVFVVPFGSFDGSGSGTVPVIEFAEFYVTGWTSNGMGFANPCKTAGDVFVPGTEKDSGAISGHFIKYVNSNTTGGSGQACEMDSVASCVAVLVK